MAYPKPLSKDKIEKLFSDWDPETVEKLHTYYEAFANLYGSVQIKEAWKVFKKFEPKIHKKQFMAFADIVRREDVPYYIYEIDELYCEERRIETERYIVNKRLVLSGREKNRFVYVLDEKQSGKPYYDKTDLLEVSHHPFHDRDIKPFIEKMTFQYGENNGKTFAEMHMLDAGERFSLEYYKSEQKKAAILKKADIPFSEKFYRKIIWSINFSSSPVNSIMHYLEENKYVFDSLEYAEEFLRLLTEFISNSHLWVNCGYTPNELHSMYAKELSTVPQTISFGSGIQKAFREGTIDKDEIIRKLKKMGVDIIE